MPQELPTFAELLSSGLTHRHCLAPSKLWTETEVVLLFICEDMHDRPTGKPYVYQFPVFINRNFYSPISVKSYVRCLSFHLLLLLVHRALWVRAVTVRPRHCSWVFRFLRSG